jgi:diguanylate cyclase (GGDEF)-like protein/PAS domain S-box-containing protein
MGVHFDPRESLALFALLADDPRDIILKTDRRGFLLYASPGIERLGIAAPNELFGPHLLDLVHPACVAEVRAAYEAAMGEVDRATSIRFRALPGSAGELWFELNLRSLADDSGAVYGAISVMRSIAEEISLEGRLFEASMTDPLTGLTNRKAFISMLQHLVDSRVGGCLALFDIDHFRAINMKYGQSAGDEVLTVFADFLRTMMRSEDIISRIGSESLAVLLPRASVIQAEVICRRIVCDLAEIREAAGTEGLAITASVGMARIAETLDESLRRAELALFLAKAKGRNRLEVDGSPSLPWAARARRRAGQGRPTLL